MAETTLKPDPKFTPDAGAHFPVDPPLPAAPEFGVGKLSILKMTLDLTNARDDEVIDIAGTWFWVQSGTNATSNADIGFNDFVSQKINVKQGLFINGVTFGKIIVTNTAQANESITIVYGTGAVNVENPADNSSSVTISSGTLTTITNTVTTEETKAATITTTADDSVAATSTETVLAANTDRREAIIKNLAANTDNIRVGDATNTGATRGHELKPGESIVLTTTAAIAVYNSGAGAQSVSLVEIAD